jgi:hypothetical protein
MNHIVIRIAFISVAIMATLTSCNDDPTVQSYYVDSQEKDGFITTTIPKSILGIDQNNLSSESRKAYESVNKINLLMLPATDNQKDNVKQETEVFNDILKKSNYKTLMTHSSDGVKARFVYEGDTDSIDELIVFGSSEDMGMGIARITGDNMNIGDLMKMMKELEKEDINPANLKGILQGMGMDVDQEMNKRKAKSVDTMEVKDI